MAETYNFEIRIGDSWPYGPTQFATVLVQQGPKNGPYTAVDLTAATISTEFSLSVEGTEILCAATTAILNQVTDKGKFTFWYPATETANLVARDYHYAIRLDFGSGRILTPIAGIAKAVYV